MDREFLHEELAHDLSEHTGKTIVMCGCGAIGSNLAESLARRGFSKFVLVDYDKVERHNISTQVWTQMDIGKSKTVVLSNRLFLATRAQAIAVTTRIDHPGDMSDITDRFCDSGSLIIDSFDNSESRSHTIGCHPNVMHVGLSGEGTAEIAWDENYALPPDVILPDPCAYPMSRSLIEAAVATAGAETVRFFLEGGGRKTATVITVREP